MIKNKKNIEGYDMLEDKVPLNKCSEKCKTISGCYGFAYNKEESKCFLSQGPIIGKPEDSMYRNDYNDKNITCNKMQPITEPKKEIPLNERRSNSVYICSDSDTTYPQMYFDRKGKFENIGEGKNIDEIYEVDNYNVDYVRWTPRFVNNTQLPILRDGKTTHKYNIDKISDINKVLEPSIIKESQIKNNVQLVVDDFKKMIQSTKNLLVVPYEKRSIPKMEKIHSYNMKNGMNRGEYMKYYKCVKNIPKQDCLKYCSEDANCVGVEWNPKFKNSQNVCCPYKSIGKYVEREGEYKTGQFYLKNNMRNIDKQNIYVKVYD